MAKNLIPEVCKLLGVEVGEEFKIKDINSDYTTSTNCLIDKYGRVNVLDHNGGRVCTTMSLDDFLTGEVYEIVKLPWKPKCDEQYWTFGYDVIEGGVICWNICDVCWIDSPVDFAYFKAGWAYRTYEEAEAALPKVAKELGMKYSLED